MLYCTGAYREISIFKTFDCGITWKYCSWYISQGGAKCWFIWSRRQYTSSDRYRTERNQSTGGVYKLIFMLKKKILTFVHHTEPLWPTYKNGQIIVLMNTVNYFGWALMSCSHTFPHAHICTPGAPPDCALNFSKSKPFLRTCSTCATEPSWGWSGKWW